MEQLQRDGSLINVVHYAYVTEGLGGGERVACMPTMRLGQQVTPFPGALTPTYMRSNDTRAVTCPACRKTHAFSEANGGVDPNAGKKH